MGYSCTRAAANMLGTIGHILATDGNRNILTIGQTQYFFERGREQNDGAITGTLVECLPNDYCRKVGTIRIEPDGSLARFPRLPRTLKTEIVDTFRDTHGATAQSELFHVERIIVS